MKTRQRLWQLTVLFIMAVFIAAQAVDVSKDDILNAARKWIADNAIFQSEQPDAIPATAVRLTDGDGQAMPLWRVDLAPSGYLVMSSDDTLPPVVTFSTAGSFDLPSDHPLPSMLARQGEIFQTELGKPQTRGNELAEENRARWNVLLNRTRGESVTPSTIVRSPMLATEWNQDAPFNYFCPSGSSYTERGITGCVATAVAQMLKYHEWPPAGTGTKESADNSGDIQGAMKADFSAPYDWGAMSDSYPGKEERDYGVSELAVARLGMEASVLVGADYGFDGTSAYSHNLNTLMSQYLGYSSSAVYGDTRSGYIGYVAQSTLYSRIRSDMTAGRPAFVSYEGHTFIADGLGTMGSQDYYHFNYGWGGYQNGWYLLTDGYEGTVIIGATTNIQPSPVAVFKPVSCEQTSSFTLSWDFPKRLTAEAFRLTKTTGTRASTVISSSISGTARSYTLTGQSGTATYTLEAKVGGSWQAVSGGATVTVKTSPAAMLELSVGDGLKSIAGKQVTMTVTANNTLASLSVTSSRTDILPASGIVVSGSGASRTVRLTPASGTVGNVLLYVTATDAAGNTVCRTAPMAVMVDEPLTWHTDKTEAFEAATANGKLVLMVGGRDTCSNTNYFRNTVCETTDVKATLLAGYELWYANVDVSGSGYSTYSSGLGGTLPFIAIIDPASPAKRLRGHGGFMSLADARVFLDPCTPYFSLSNSETFALGTTQTLELSVLKSGAEIRYRLDSSMPTMSDTLYSSAISLTATTTVSARAFLNGEAVSDVVTKTYTFLEQVATPVLNVPQNHYFFGSCLVTATCATSGATIRYTTDGYIPTASSPVLPAGGVSVTEYTAFAVKAFKDGMKESGYSYSILTPYEEFPEAQAVVIKGDVTMLKAGTPWTLQTETYHSSPSAMQSGSIGNSASTVLAAKVVGPGTISFQWKVSSEQNYDFLKFSIDGVMQERISGTVDWTEKTFSVTGEGDHYLTWTYSKDGSQTVGSDCGWIDDVSWDNDPHPVPTTITISGPGSIATASTGTYTCTVTWSDGTTSTVTPTWSLSSTTYASVSTAGVVTNKNTTTNDQTVTLNASYTANGVTRTASKSGITLSKKVLTGITISGNATIATASTATYTCTATWSYGSNTTVTPTWSLSSTTYASVSTTGVLTNKNTTTTDQTVTLNASYTANGVTKTASKSGITLEKKVLTGITISGNATIATASTATYTCTASWSYGPNTTVTPTWSLSSTTYASVSTAGVVTNKNTTTTDQTVTLNVSYTINGVTKTASKSITLSKKVLTGITISGDATIASAGTATYTCTATWSYGPNTTVTPTWSLSSTTYASVSTAGVVTNKNTTTTDQTVTLNASYAINGTTKTDAKPITLSYETPELTWHTSLADAAAAATENGKLVLMLGGRDTCSNCNYFRNTVCETADIKATLLANYELWYANVDTSGSGYSAYSSGLGSTLPFLAIIDPADQSKRLRGHGGFMSIAEARLFLDLDTPYFSLDASEIYTIGTTQTLELSVLRTGAVIRYRLDATTPTASDTLYSGALSLTSTITVSARAFVDGVPIGNVVTKTYTFLQQVATPVLSTAADDYFFGSRVVTASCATSGAVIRYTTNLYYPTESDPVFPAGGLTVTEDTVVLVRAFKDGMKMSDWAVSELYALTEIPDAYAIVTGNMLIGSTTPLWNLQTTTYNSEPSSMQSATIDNDGSTVLVAKVNGSGTLTFYWKVSSETNYDKLSFSIDGTQKAAISGTPDWAQKTYTISGTGEHYLIWKYAKDYSVSSNSDCGWVDDIVWSVSLTDITITGNATIASGGTAAYTCTANWADGTTSTVSPTWSLSSSTYASVSEDGVVTNKNTTTSDQTVTLTASYTVNGETKTDSKTITLSKKVLTGITISGSATIATASTATYTCTASWSYGDTTTVTPTWSLSATTYASVSTAGVVTNKNTEITDKTVTLNASYTVNGVTKTASKSGITLSKKILTGIAISGPATIATASTATYTCTATWSYGSNTTVTPTWSLSSTTYASISTGGVVTNKNTETTDKTVTLNASYTVNGVTKTASKSGITLSKKILTGITISGPDSIATSSTATYTCTATWSYGPNTTVTPTWSLSSTTYASVSTAGVVTNQNTTATDKTVTLNASYTVNGVTKTASISNITLQVGDTLTWYTAKAEAMAAATDGGKLVLMVAGRDTCLNTNYFRNTVCATEDIKAMLTADYVLWYANVDSSSEYSAYASGLGNILPFIAIIDPLDQSARLRGHGGPVTIEEARVFLDLDLPFFSLDDSMIYASGTTQSLQLSVLRDGAEIRYRLDGTAPTSSDTFYSTAISLTRTTTVSARAFKNGEAISDTVTKTYTFLQQVATPVLSDTAYGYFFGSSVVTATCSTSGATIRYTTDGSNPTASSPVFPADGLTVSETTTVIAVAFKDGMKESAAATRQIVELEEMEDALEIVTEGDVLLGSPDTAWYLQTTTYNSAPSAMRSGAIGNNASTSLVAKVSGAGMITFNWKVSSQSNDVLSFSIDGAVQTSISGTSVTAWSLVPYAIVGEGEHYLTWTYTKDSSYSYGSDCGWVDDISWEPGKFSVQVLNGSGGGICAVGTSVTVTASEAPAGAEFRFWDADGIELTDAQKYNPVLTFIMPNDLVKLAANFYEDHMTSATDFQFAIQNGKATITSYTGNQSAVAIPVTADGVPVTSIGYDAFYGRNRLKSVLIPDGVTSIGNGAFGYCSSLETVVIPESVTYLDSHVFLDCTSLTEIFIPKSVSAISSNGFLFSNCTSLERIDVDEENPYFVSEDGILYNKAKTILISYPPGKKDEVYEIPETVNTMREGVMYGSVKLTKVVISNGVRTIPWSAFYGCTNLKEVVIPDSVTYLDGYAFGACSSLRYITIPDQVTTIGYYTFTGCSSLQYITIGTGVTSIDSSDNSFNNCRGLQIVRTDNAYVQEWFASNFPDVLVVGTDYVYPPLVIRQDGKDGWTFSRLLWIDIVSMNDDMDGLELRYTLDGTEPTASSTLYTGPFAVSESCTVTAVFFQGGEPCSETGTTAFVKYTDLDELFAGSGLAFETEESVPWTVVEDTAYESTWVAKSGAIGHSQSTSMQTTVHGSGVVSFYWKVSSERYYDKLHFYVDGEEAVTSISGSVSWREVTVEIDGDGEHVLTWMYTKDGTVNDGSDCGWVASIVWEPIQVIELSAGWNWVSFNVLPESHKVGDVLGTSGFTANDIIQTNGGLSRFTGTSWMPGSFTVEYGKLYQIYIANDMTLEISGMACDSFSMPLVSGWNWIGSPTTETVSPVQLTHSGGWTAGDRIQTTDGGVTYTGSKWIPAGFTLEPGKGYQIYTANEGVLMFPSPNDDALYAIIDLSNGPDAESYPVRYMNTPPDLDDDTCRTTELWLRRIPKGTFVMGSPEDELGREAARETQHQVTLTQDYYIGVFECTQMQWELVMGSNPASYIGDSRPVEQITYDMIRGTGSQAGAGWPAYGHAVDASSFMGKLQAKTGLVFDLPTEAQWEYACRAGTMTALNSGKNLTSLEKDANMDEVGRYYYNASDGRGGYSQHTTVGSYLPNAWGLYDMHGNVYEWCLDWYGSYGTEAVEDPAGSVSGTYRVGRSGHWGYVVDQMTLRCRSACRSNFTPSSTGNLVGFRIALHP